MFEYCNYLKSNIVFINLLNFFIVNQKERFLKNDYYVLNIIIIIFSDVTPAAVVVVVVANILLFCVVMCLLHDYAEYASRLTISQLARADLLPHLRVR